MILCEIARNEKKNINLILIYENNKNHSWSLGITPILNPRIIDHFNFIKIGWLPHVSLIPIRQVF